MVLKIKRVVIIFLSSFFDERFKYGGVLSKRMKEELQAYGLSDKEIEIYLAGLKAGSVTANGLSERSGIRRSTVYEVVESLKKKGLVTSLKKDKKFYFEMVQPASLIGLLKEKERMIESILPDLNKINQSLSEKPRIEFFEGVIGIKHALLEMLNYKEIRVYGASKIGDQILGSYTSNFAKKRAERKVKMYAIIESNIPKHMMEKDVAKVTKIKTLPLFNNHQNAYFIYGDKLIIVTLGEELTAIRITSKLLAESQRKIFESFWKIAR